MAQSHAPNDHCVRFAGTAPFRIRVDRRLPALSSFLGQRPAQEMRWVALAKRLMSLPISAVMICALSR